MILGAPTRYERKFVFSRPGPIEAVRFLRLHPAAFRETYPPRRVNNLYLDNPTLDLYSDSVDGAASRVKVRIRWYGDPWGEIPAPVLEFKEKRGEVGAKIGFRLPPLTLRDGMPPRPVCDRLRELDLPSGLATLVSTMTVSLMNGYHRRYLASREGRYRITIDKDMWCRPVRTRIAPLRTFDMDKRRFILELKYGLEDDDEVRDLTQSLPFRLDKSSKYVDGLRRACLW